MSPKPNSPISKKASFLSLPEKPKDLFAALFFSALFFLGSADLFFTTHLWGFNFRWGQGLLLLAAIPAFYRLGLDLRYRSPGSNERLRLLLHWTPFFLVYGSAALLSAIPLLTGVKWAWGLFNIGLAALVCLDEHHEDSLERGFEGGILLIALLIWIETIALYVLDPLTSVQEWRQFFPSAVSFLSIPIGYSQRVGHFMDIVINRPHAFYYEPSYAGCALSFSLFFIFFRDSQRTGQRRGWIPALVIGAIILTSSRAGIFSVVFYALYLFWASGRRGGANPLRRVLFRAFLASALLLGLFFMAPNGRKYFRFLTGPMLIEAPSRIHNEDASEGGRWANAKTCLGLFARHPLLGNGIILQDPSNNRGLSQISYITWLEIGIESGALGILTFLFAFLANIRLAWSHNSNSVLKTLVLGAWAVHFAFQFLLSSTFPRLDYWLLFFLSLRLLMSHPEQNDRFHDIRASRP